VRRRRALDDERIRVAFGRKGNEGSGASQLCGGVIRVDGDGADVNARCAGSMRAR